MWADQDGCSQIGRAFYCEREHFALGAVTNGQGMTPELDFIHLCRSRSIGERISQANK
jgi:hypothetical protein